MATVNRRVLPGFYPSLGFTLLYLSALVLIPLAACFVKAASLSPAQFWAAVWTERARAAYALTFGTSLVAAAIDGVLGLFVAWVLVRYEFPSSDCSTRCRRALRPADRGGGAGLFEPVCRERLAGPVPGSLGNQGGVLPGWRWCWC